MKHILLFTIILFTFPFISFGQSSASADINVTAEVLDPVQITEIRAVAFGELIDGNGLETISSTNISDIRSGKVLITGTDGSSVTVTFPSTIVMSGVGSASNELTFTTGIASHANTDNQSSATEFNSATSGNFTFNGGSEYIWIGGSINPDGKNVDSYIGVLTVSIAYQ